LPQLFATLSGENTFTTLDLAHNYLQLELDDESQELVTIKTCKGFYKYKHLPFAVASAPAIFQHTIEAILQSLQTTLMIFLFLARKTKSTWLI